jgi:hypothetical protein
VELPGRSHDDFADDLCDLCGVRHPHRAAKREHVAAGTTNAWSSKGGATTTSPTTCTIRASCVACAGRPKQGHITVGMENARSSQGAAATMTSRRPARSASRASPASSDRTRVHRGGHEEHAELRGSSRHDDTAATCASCVDRTRVHRGGHEEHAELRGSSRHDDTAATCASCITRAKRPNASTSRRARRTRGAPREQPPRRLCGDLHVVRRPCRPNASVAHSEHEACTEHLSYYCYVVLVVYFHTSIDLQTRSYKAAGF